jgi:hypothetical protein
VFNSGTLCVKGAYFLHILHFSVSVLLYGMVNFGMYGGFIGAHKQGPIVGAYHFGGHLYLITILRDTKGH